MRRAAPSPEASAERSGQREQESARRGIIAVVNAFSSLSSLAAVALWGLLFAPMAALAADARVPAAAELAARYPPGSIATAEQARAAQEAADRADVAAQAAWRDAQERCAHVFFVTSCGDQALKARREVEREARRVRVEANAVERRIDAQARATRRAEQAARALTPEQRAEREAAARAEWQGRQQRALDNAVDRDQRDRDAVQRKQELERRLAEQQAIEARRAAQKPARAENARQFEARQRQATAHAEEKARERALNERKRADRQRERERKMNEQGFVPPVPASGASAQQSASKGPVEPGKPAVPQGPGPELPPRIAP